MSDETALISIKGDITKPVSELIEKISNGVGALCEPHLMVRRAKAEAKVELIRAEAKEELERRAVNRFIQEETKKQLNIESITQKAIPLLNEKSSPQDISDDWITNFFDKSRIVSDDEMQNLWARILAGEAENPGKFSRQTINIIANFDKEDAQTFTQLCAFICWLGNPIPLIYNLDHEIYIRNKINVNLLTHLESLGVIHFETVGEFSQVLKSGSSCLLGYYDRVASITIPDKKDITLPMGKVCLTRAGRQLYSICETIKIEDFFEYVFKTIAVRALGSTVKELDPLEIEEYLKKNKHHLNASSPA